MTNKCIADEVIREIQRGTLISLITECAEGLGYSIQRTYETAEEQPISGRFMMGNPSQALLDHNRHLQTRLVLFATDKKELESTGTGTMVGLGTVIAIPIPPNMRVQVWCESDWQGIGFDPGFTPCEVGAAIMRFLLRMVEGVERADAWRAPWEKQEAATDVQNDKGTRKRGPNEATLGKMERVRAIRQKSKSKGRVTINFTNACQQADIWPETVRANDPELVRNWSNYDY